MRASVAATAAVVGLVIGLMATGCGADQQRPQAVAAAAPVDRHRAIPEQPNIVVVMADDMRADDLRFMPHVRRSGRRHGTLVPELLQPVPVVLSGSRVVPHRAVPAQPSDPLQRGAMGVRRVRRPGHHRHVAPSGRLPDRLRRQVPQQLRRRALRRDRRAFLALRAGRVVGLEGSGAASSRQPDQERRHLRLLPPDLQRGRPHRRHAPGRVPDRRGRQLRTRVAGPVRRGAGPVLPLPLGPGPAHRLPGGARRPGPGELPGSRRRPGPTGSRGGTTSSSPAAPASPPPGSPRPT